MSLSRQEWFDTEALEAFECDNLDTSATTAQHLRATFRSDFQIEPPEEVPVNSKFSSTSVGTQKVAGKSAVRSVTKQIVAAGQQARPRSVTVGRTERLLRSKRSFSELRVQRGECMILCDERLCSFPTLSEQESSQARQTEVSSKSRRRGE